MKNLNPFILLAAVCLTLSCKKDQIETPVVNVEIDPSSIEIADYTFNFQTQFTLEEILEPGDSYVGNVNGDHFSFFFDYGWFTTPLTNLPANEYTVIEDEIQGHYRQIVIPLDSETNDTRIHLYNISDKDTSPHGGYNSLTMYVNNISKAEQDNVVNVFQNVVIQ